MSFRGKKIFLLNLGGLIFFILDRVLKNLYFFDQDLSFLKFQKNSKFLYFFQGIFFYWLTFLIFLGLIFYLIKKYQQNQLGLIFSLTLILVGGFSNFLDRLLHGFVIDYFNFFSLWSFNIADIIILGGSIIFFLNIRENKNNVHVS